MPGRQPRLNLSSAWLGKLGGTCLPRALRYPCLISASCQLGTGLPTSPATLSPWPLPSVGSQRYSLPSPKAVARSHCAGGPRVLNFCQLTRHLHACHHTVTGSIAGVAPRVSRLHPTDRELTQHSAGLDLHPLTRLHLLAIPEPAHSGIGTGQLTRQHQVLPSHQAAMLHDACVAHNGHWWLWD